MELNKSVIKNEAYLGKAEGLGSQGIKAGGFVFASFIGSVGDKGLVGIETSDQVIQLIKNVEALLSTEGATLKDIVKCTIFIKDSDDYDVVNQVYKEMMPKPYPARSCVCVSSLFPEEVKIEMEIVAYINCQ